MSGFWKIKNSTKLRIIFKAPKPMSYLVMYKRFFIFVYDLGAAKQEILKQLINQFQHIYKNQKDFKEKVQLKSV